jgi:CheY-like chemotaxis protein
LVVDDCPINRMVLVRHLAKLGIAADSAGDGEAAVMTWRQNKHGLVLMDCAMPRLDGYAATRAIRLSPGGDATRILAITAYTDPDIPTRCHAAGMDGCLFKPVTSQALAQAVAQGRLVAEAA